MKPHGYWTDRRLRKEALKHPCRGDFQKYSHTAYQIARRKGMAFLDFVCRHMNPPLTQAYSLKEIKTEANKHKRRQDFLRSNPSMYIVAQRRNDYEEIVSHMASPLTEAYSLEEIKSAAKKCKEFGEFKKKFPKLYSAASKRRILQKICSHMKHSKNTSDLENEVFLFIKKVFPNTKKLIDRKVKIKNKPHIKGFHIDIFVPELNKGIEFDGKYWHSFEGLKRSRTKWPKNDIINYHQIKDSWFLSKGIKILHVKEQDWLKNKDKCIKECLNFLKRK